MSQLKTILNNYNSLFIDFRTGSFLNRGSMGGSVSKNNSPVINNAYAKVDSSNYYKCEACNIGTDDFTVLIKGAVVDEHTGLGNCIPLILNGSNLRLTINGNNYDSTATVNSLVDRVIGVSAERYGNALFYANDGQLGNLVDISGSSAVNILNAVYTVEGDTGYDQAEWALMVKGKALTESEINSIVSELSGVPDQRVNSKAYTWNPVTKVYTPKIYFKGEMHALANERTISSCKLENTDFQISSGSFKLITEDVNGYESRVIECVTAGYLRATTGDLFKGTSNAFINRGSGYEEITGDDFHNVIVNGDFSAWTDPTVPDGWIKVGTFNATNYVEENPSGHCRMVSDGTNLSITQYNLIVGKTYKATINVTDVTSGVGRITESAGFTAFDSVGTFERIFVSAGNLIRFERGSACDITIDNIAVEELDSSGNPVSLIAMTAGDKLVYASKNPKQSLYNKA
jgi:hypothetical protein